MATLADVAQMAGVSKAAASYVLGARPSAVRLGSDTRVRILNAARELGYQPNPIAAALSTGRTHTIGLLMNDSTAFLTHPNGALSFNAIVRAAARHHYRIMVLSADPQGVLDARVMDGLIVMGGVAPDWAKRLSILAAGIPVITNALVPGTVQLRGIDSGGLALNHRVAAGYLYDLGHRDLAIVDVAGAPDTHSALVVFRQVAEERGHDVRLHPFRDRWQLRTYPTTEEICRLSPLPTAVCAFDDDYARMLISRLAQLGVRVPQDVSVFSRNTHLVGFQTLPALTGIDLHQERLWDDVLVRFVAVLNANARIAQVNCSAVAAELVVRDSCAPPRTRSTEASQQSV